jgi:Fic family protein
VNLEKPNNDLPLLPPNIEIDSKRVLNYAIKANRELARLKGYCSVLPNESILLDSIILKEATASSEIENIVTTQDELYKALISKQKIADPPTKEVLNYRSAMWVGYSEMQKNGLLTANIIKGIQAKLEGNTAGIRKLTGTRLTNDVAGEVVYTPPDNEDSINKLLKNLEHYINTDDEVDDLVKMALIHYQFESIHPFYDGNGRTGRIINVLYLILKGLLDTPVLYLSSHIINHKSEYYTLLQEVRTKEKWEDWIIFMLAAIEKTSIETFRIITSIVSLLDKTIEKCKAKLPRTTYSKELIEQLYIQPYTKIEFLVKAGIGERRTASKYLKQLEEIGVLRSFQLWKETIYVNIELFDLLKG